MITPVFDCRVAFDAVGLPPQDISTLTFCQSSKPAKVREFGEGLRLTQTHATAATLYTAVPELARLKTDCKTRFEMLEALWPAVQHVSAALARECLAQIGGLSEAQRKGLIVAQALQKHLLDGYMLVAREMACTSKPKPPQQELLVNAAHRGLGAASLLLLRNYQLYAQAPPGLWRRVHTLWRALRELELDRRHTTLSVGSEKLRSPLEQYLRLLSLASASPNQLTQNEVSATFDALGLWAGSVRLMDAKPQHTFLVDPGSDQGPVLAARAPQSCWLGLDFTLLEAGLNGDERGQMELLNSSGRLSVPPDVSATLLRQLLNAWTQTRARDSERRRVDMEVEVAVGLIDAHLFLCEGEPFEQYIREHDTPHDGPGVSEGFADLINKLSRPKDVGITKVRQSLFSVTLQNVSNGGCLLYWPGDAPSRIEAGELLALRESGRPRWQVGVVRWLRKLKTGSEMGVQLLGNEMTPYGAAAAFDLGGFSDYTRALHLPRPFLGDASGALLTPAVPFQENTRVRIKRDGRARDVRLSRCLLATGKVKLFAFESINPDQS